MSDRGEKLMVIGFEIALTGALILSIRSGSLYPALTSLAGMGVLVLPPLLLRKGLLHLPWAVTAAAGAVLVLHSYGILFRFYDLLWWWDTLTHLTATLIIALVVSLALVSAERTSTGLKVPVGLLPAATLACVIILGVIWEVLEFFFDGALGLNMQYSLDDSATDLSFDILGGGLVALALVPLAGIVKKAGQDMFLRPLANDPSSADQ